MFDVIIVFVVVVVVCGVVVRNKKMATVVTSSSEQQRRKNENLSIDNEQQQQQQQLATSLVTSTTTTSVVYDVEHLATFSTTGSHETSPSNNRLVPNDGETNISSSSSNNNKCFTSETLPNSATVNSTTTTTTTTTTPKVALQRLFELEKQSGIWTQRMQIELQDDYMLIVDCETNSVVERFERECVTRPEAFNEYNDIYNNIVVFIIQQSKSANTTTTNEFSKKNEKEEVSSGEGSDNTLDLELLKVEEGELHIFQCVSHKAQQLVSDILTWKIQPTSDNKNMANLSTTSENNVDNSSSSSHRDIKRGLKQHEEKQAAAMPSKLSNQNKSTEFNLVSPSSANKSLGISGSSSSNSSGKPVVTVASSSNTSENVPIVNVNVKETVQVFNQIAALREKR